MEIYKKNSLNPFASLLVVIIQIPIILALFWVFKASFSFDPKLLYSFVHIPDQVSTLFLGFIDITAKSWFFAALVALTQFIQMKISLPPTPASSGKGNFSDDFQRSMNLQMKYFMPALIGFVAASLPVAISLYWVTSNVFAIGQELFVRRKIVVAK
jgi:YidC/Oxa1 family membrane protein insertase